MTTDAQKKAIKKYHATHKEQLNKNCRDYYYRTKDNIKNMSEEEIKRLLEETRLRIMKEL